MLDRKIAPPFVESTAFELIRPATRALANGIEVFFVSGGTQEVIKITLIFRGGRWFEQVWGASHFSSHLLSKGTGQKSSFEIAQIFDRYGAHLEVNAGLDFISISLYALTQHLQPVLLLLDEIIRQPVFPQKELEQSKTIYQQNLKVNLEKTSFLASQLFRKSLFGEDHPYGKEPEEKDIDVIDQADVANHYKAFFTRPSVFVAGKIESKTEKLITDTLVAWSSVESPERKITIQEQKPFHQYTEKEDSVQSSIRMGCRSLFRSHPDYAAATFVCHILGGYFGSRLMKNIREEKGLTYGIHASLHPLKNDGYLVIGADVNKENVAITFNEIRKELTRLRTEKITVDELVTARNHFIGSLQSEITTPFAHADKLKTIHLFGLPATYYQDMIRTIQGMNANHVLEISEKYFNESNLFELAVG
jgi:predicted Zn-dependent peptidase